MIRKIRVLDLSITLAALAALIFLLPTTQETNKGHSQKTQTSTTKPNHTKMGLQQPIGDQLLRIS